LRTTTPVTLGRCETSSAIGIAPTMPDVACHPSIIPATMISTNCSTSSASTVIVLAASSWPLDNGVEPGRFNAP